jgi:hypothetical protein
VLLQAPGDAFASAVEVHRLAASRRINRLVAIIATAGSPAWAQNGMAQA